MVIGVDPHKLSVTIEARDNREILRAVGQFATDGRSYRQLLEVARQWPERIWAVEGANGIGRPLTQRLLASGELVLDVPAKLAARARVFDTGQGRKTDATDAHAIVMVALRDKGLREVSSDPELVVLRMLCDRRDELSRARVQALNRMHRLFLGLLPGGAPVKKSVRQYQALLATVRPRDLAGKTRRRMAAEELEDLHRLDAKLKSMKAELKAAVLATGSHLMDIHGIGPAGAARILADVGDVAGSLTAITSHPGPARLPLMPPAASICATGSRGPGTAASTTCSISPASSSSATTPQAARITAASSPRARPRWKRCAACGGACPTRSTGSWQPTPAARMKRAPGGHPGASLISSAAGLSPDTGTSDQPLPGPADLTLPPPRPAPQPMAPAAAATRRRARGVNVERPAGRTTLTPTSAAAPSTAPGPCP